jgi:hypothetical protein
MVINLKQYINPDGILEVYFEGLKAVISHDKDCNVYHCIIIDVHSDRCCEIIPLPVHVDTDRYKIMFRKNTGICVEPNESIF